MNSNKLMFIAAAACWAAIAFAEEAPRTAKILSEHALPPISLTVFGYSEAEITTAEQNGLTRSDLPAIGSGLQRLAGNQFVGATDRGPTFTRTSPSAGRVFPLPSYTPALVFFKAHGGELSIQSIMPLVVDDAGSPATGFASSLAEDTTPFASPTATTPLPFNPNGIDVEDVHTLRNGNFIIVDEYSPSFAIVNECGKILKRYTPQGKTLAGAAYPVADILPGVLTQRRSNRGIEAVTVSPDGNTAYIMTQSPLGPTGSTAPTRNSRVIRVFQLDLTDPMDARITAQYVLLMSPASTYPAGNRQQDLKISAVEWVASNKLLILERSDEVGIGGAKLVLADLSNATDITPIAAAQTTTLESVAFDLAAAGITPASSTVVYSNEETPTLNDFKLEGLSILNRNDVAISNDNDFGIGDNVTGTPSKLWVIRLKDALPLGN